jgi:phosphoribosylaminoimidazole-succinocarboxamide synthase
VGEDRCKQVADAAVSIYATASAFALSKGVIIADTKFEFGVNDDGELILADEVLTPDSSRFWPADAYTPGKSQDRFVSFRYFYIFKFR